MGGPGASLRWAPPSSPSYLPPLSFLPFLHSFLHRQNCGIPPVLPSCLPTSIFLFSFPSFHLCPAPLPPFLPSVLPSFFLPSERRGGVLPSERRGGERKGGKKRRTGRKKGKKEKEGQKEMEGKEGRKEMKDGRTRRPFLPRHPSFLPSFLDILPLRWCHFYFHSLLDIFPFLISFPSWYPSLLDILLFLVSFPS